MPRQIFSTFSSIRSLLPITAFFLFTAKGFAQALSASNDSVLVSIAPQYDSVGGFHRFLFGEGYRKLWAAPVKVKVFNLNTENGGLVILQRGGGLQTKSLRLKDKTGKEYVLRTIQKYPERGLPENLRETVAKDILQDQVVTGHPFSALTVPPLAEALGVPHSNPQIVYIPDDPAFGAHRADFANSVLLFEEREPVDSSKTDNTEKVQRKLEEDNDYSIDQKAILRARLLDLVLGDWDRHEDQWRWQVIKKNNETEYLPVPRDRDKVFYNTTGLLPKLLSHQWLKANLQGFNKKIKDIPVYNYNNRFYDRYFLNRLTQEQWKNEVAFVQKNLTDDLFNTAVHLLPVNIYALSGDAIQKTLIARRNNLENQAMEYYSFLSKYPDILASDKKEQVGVNYKTNGHVEVTIQKIKKDGSLGGVLFKRDFVPSITDEIRIYGMSGEDVFRVYGAGKSSIKTRLIGGNATDSFIVENTFGQKNKLFIYDRSDETNILPVSSQAKIKTSADTMVNRFDRKAFAYDQQRIIGSAFFNPDQGFLLRAGFILEKQGFRKTPYASKHLFYINYATLWKSIMFTYSGKFREVLGKNDINIDVVSKGPSNIDNFFGVGNETVFNNQVDDAKKYFQNFYDHVIGEIELSRSLSRYSTLTVGPGVEFYTSSNADNQNKFLKSYNFFQPGERVFSDKFFAGVSAGLSINTKEQTLLPTKGIFWNTEARAMKQLNGLKTGYTRVFSTLSFYLPIKDSTFVIANRISGGTTTGDPGFFQQHKLGGPVNLRGFNINRFTGTSVLYDNIEVRLKLFDFNSYLTPGSLGLIGFSDIGRVWVKGEKSSKWHTGTGGGIYIIPAELLVIQALVAFSDEGTYPYFSIGYRF